MKQKHRPKNLCAVRCCGVCCHERHISMPPEVVRVSPLNRHLPYKVLQLRE